MWATVKRELRRSRDGRDISTGVCRASRSRHKEAGVPLCLALIYARTPDRGEGVTTSEPGSDRAKIEFSQSSRQTFDRGRGTRVETVEQLAKACQSLEAKRAELGPCA